MHKILGALTVLLASLVIVPASLAAPLSPAATSAPGHTAHSVKRTSAHRTQAKKVRATVSAKSAKSPKTVKATKLTKTVKSPKVSATTKANQAPATDSRVDASPVPTTSDAAPSVVAATTAAISSLTQTAASIATPDATSAATSSPAATRVASPAAATTRTPTTTSPATSSSATPVLGTFGISTPAEASAWKSAGGNAVVVGVGWQPAQPTQNGPVSLAGAGDGGDNVISEIQVAHQLGLAVYLEIDLQYPPQWVLSSVPEFKDQGGDSWAQPTIPGADVRDWVWTQAGRQDVSDFVGGVMAQLQPYLSDIAGIRAGGGVYGELDFPPSGSVNGQSAFWGYDAAAQTGAGLAAGESATPLPGYVYGTGTAAQNTEWANWYLGSLATWIKWYVQLLQTDGWTGPTYVLSPSSGQRSNFSTTSAAYEQQLAYGTDWGVMMNSYDQVSNVWPWSTWADDTEPYYHAGDTVDSDAAAWRKLLELAQARGLASHIMGENTGGGGAPAIHQLMSGALAAGYTGIFYNNDQYLQSTGLTPYLVSQFQAYAA